MKKLQKVLILILSIAVISAALIVAVNADNGVIARIDGKEYTDFAEALDATADGGTLTLLSDTNVTKAYVLKKNVTVNLNGKTLTSEASKLFELTPDASASVTALNVTGNGRINLSGSLVASSVGDTASNFAVTVSGSGEGMYIYHTGESARAIVSTYGGTWNFENLEIYTEASSVKNTAFIETNAESTTGSKMTFNKVIFTSDATTAGSGGTALVNVVATGQLLIQNSAFHTQNTAIHTGYVDYTSVGLTKNHLVIDNSIISAVSTYNNKQRTYGILASPYDMAETPGPKGTAEIRNSLLECSSRLFCGVSASIQKDEQGNKVADLYVINAKNSVLKSGGSIGPDRANVFSRYVAMNLDANTKILSTSENIVGVGTTDTPDKEGSKVIGSVGTRVAMKAATIANYDTASEKYTTFGVSFPDGSFMSNQGWQKGTSSATTQQYVWAFDPVGDPDYPWVIAKVGEVDSLLTPDYKKNYTFDGLEFTHSAADMELDVWRDQKNTGNWSSNTDKFWNINSDNQTQQWECRRGTLTQVRTNNNNAYMRYWINPLVGKENEKTRNFTAEGAIAGSSNNDPYFIMGAHHNDRESTLVDGDGRVKVIVLDFDFGTDSEIGYPFLNVSAQSRMNTETGPGNNAKNNVLKIQKDGSVINDLDSKSSATIYLKPAGEWNRFSVVFYTDPVNTNAIGYVYLNGELIGTTPVCKTFANSFIMGMRFDVDRQVDQPVGASFCVDNVSIRSYKEYQFSGEADGSKTAKSPEKYMTSAPTRPYMQAPFSVMSKTYQTFDAAIDAANTMGAAVELLRDIETPITATKEGTLVTNGYSINLSSDSLAALVEFDDNGAVSKYTFSSTYNKTLDYYWYHGEMGNSTQISNINYYTKTTVKIGQTPTSPLTLPEITYEAGVYKKLAGWAFAPDATYAPTLAPLTLSEAIAQSGNLILLYPIYSEVDIDDVVAPGYTARLVKADTSVAFAYSNSDTKAFYRNLKGGDTLTLYADFTLDTANTQFRDDSVNHGVTLDNDYTDAELALMKSRASKISIDVNGYEWKLTAKGTIARVSRNINLNVYSSRPGGSIVSRSQSKNSSNVYEVNSERMFAIFGNEKVCATHTDSAECGNCRLVVTNAHIHIGTVTLDDGTVAHGSNLTMNGGVIIEGITGDNSCSITTDGIVAFRGAPTSSAMIMARFYDGEILIKNSIFVSSAANTSDIIDMKVYNAADADNADMTPHLVVDNSLIITGNATANSSTKGIVLGRGDAANIDTIEYRNLICNGRLNPTESPENFLMHEGVSAVANNMDPNKSYASGVSLAKYNRPMTLNMLGTVAGGDDTHILKLERFTIKSTSSGGIQEGKYFYVVEAGYESLVDTTAADYWGHVVLPAVLAQASTKEVYTVTYKDLAGNVLKTEDYAKGANPDVTGLSVGAAATVGPFTLTPDGSGKWLPELDNGITENITVFPSYTATVNSDIKAGFVMSDSFNLNLYVPKSITDAGIAVEVMADVSNAALVGVASGENTVYSVPISVTNANVEVLLTVKLTYNDANLSEITAEKQLSISLASYAEEILKNEGSYTAAERNLVWHAVKYATEASRYFGSSAIYALEPLLTTYSGANTEEPSIDYAGAIENIGLSEVFTGAAYKLEQSPSLVLYLKEGFVGTVTLKLGAQEAKTYEITAESDGKVVLEGIALCDFLSTVTVEASGTVNGAAATVTGGSYNFDTYAAYHSENQSTSEAAVALLDALYAYAALASAAN